MVSSLPAVLATPWPEAGASFCLGLSCSGGGDSRPSGMMMMGVADLVFDGFDAVQEVDGRI